LSSVQEKKEKHPQREGIRFTIAKSIIALGACLLVLAVAYLHMVAAPVKPRVGQIIPYSVFAPIGFTYQDSTLLEELTGSVMDGEPVPYIDPAIKDAAIERFRLFRSNLNELRTKIQVSQENEVSDSNESGRELLEQVSSRFQISVVAIERLLRLQDAEMDKILAEAEQKLKKEMDDPVTELYAESIQAQAAKETISKPTNIFKAFIVPNLQQYSPPNMVDQRRELARVSIEKGDTIIVEGAVVTQRVIDQLNVLQQALKKQNLVRFGGLLFLVLVLMTWWYIYIRHTGRNLYSANRLAQLSAILLVFYALGVLIGRLPFNFSYYAVAFAVGAFCTLIVLVYGRTSSLYLGLGLVLLLSVTHNFSSTLVIYTATSALFPAIALSPEAGRRQQVLFSLLMGMINMIMGLTVIMISVQTLHTSILSIAFLSGFLSVVLAIGLIPIIETVTQELTPGKLIEYANPEQKELRELKREAHGTYVHSEMVADLSEEACKAIGAKSMLAKVGALYHDIGKLKRPKFFAENIHDLNKNPHSSLPPITSVRILKDHVTDGLAMAAERRLPEDLYRFIEEHHGTYLIKYFYYVAKKLHEENPEENPAPVYEEYCYDGPKPCTRETGVVMLADVTEAFVRARQATEQSELEDIVTQVIDDKIKEQQLVDSGLTVGDLSKIHKAFVDILVAQRHTRVSYPKDKPPPVQFHYLENSRLG
jgi:hypothetical protein